MPHKWVLGLIRQYSCHYTTLSAINNSLVTNPTLHLLVVSPTSTSLLSHSPHPRFRGDLASGQMSVGVRHPPTRCAILILILNMRHYSLVYRYSMHFLKPPAFKQWPNNSPALNLKIWDVTWYNLVRRNMMQNTHKIRCLAELYKSSLTNI